MSQGGTAGATSCHPRPAVRRRSTPRGGVAALKEVEVREEGGWGLLVVAGDGAVSGDAGAGSRGKRSDGGAHGKAGMRE